MSQKYDPPAGPPPPAYGSEAATGPNPPQAAHIPPQSTGQTNPPSDYYGASPQVPNANTYPPGAYVQGPPQGQYPNQYPPQGGYYAPGPQMGYPQQGAYGPQGGYYNGGYAQYDDRRGGASTGFAEAMLASLACCCCLDACLLF